VEGCRAKVFLSAFASLEEISLITASLQGGCAFGVEILASVSVWLLFSCIINELTVVCEVFSATLKRESHARMGFSVRIL
jgi:hypothetical protein